MVGTHFTGLIFVLSVFVYGCSCLPTGSKNEIPAKSANFIPGLRKQLIKDSSSEDFTESFDLLERNLDSSTQAYKQVIHIIQNNYNAEIALKEGYTELVEVMLDNGLPINHRYTFGKLTMLCAAALYGQYELSNLLIQRGANVDLGNLFDVTPLHLAARKGYVNIVELLVNNGANIDATDDWANTPLHHAVWENRVTEARWLIRHGCDKTKRNWWFRTAKSYADTPEMKKVFDEV